MVGNLSDIPWDELLLVLSRFADTLEAVSFHVGGVENEMLQHAEGGIKAKFNERLPHTTVELAPFVSNWP